MLTSGWVFRRSFFAARRIANAILSLRGASRRQSICTSLTEDLEAAGIAGYGARQANLRLGPRMFFALITLLKTLPLRPKYPCAGDFGYRHENLEHPRGRRLARLPAAQRARGEGSDASPFFVHVPAAVTCGGCQGRMQSDSMATAHQQVIENFIKEGKGGSGTYVKASEKDDAVFSTYRRRWESPRETPLAVRLSDDGFLANGGRLNWPSNRHQGLVLRTLEASQAPFGVVPFD